MPKGLKKGSVACRWMERVDDRYGGWKQSERGFIRLTEGEDVDWIDELKKTDTAATSIGVQITKKKAGAW